MLRKTRADALSSTSATLDANQTKQWATNLDIPYGGQSLGTYANLVFETLLRRKCRKNYSQAEERTILQQYGYKCALCDDELSKCDLCEFDHVVPLGKGGRDELGNIQSLCVQCHRTKTIAEGGVLGHVKNRL